MWHDLLDQGIQQAQAGNEQQAEQLLTRAVQENPDEAEIWLWLGKVSAEPERKRYCFDRALQLNSSMIEAWLELNKIEEKKPSVPPPTVIHTPPATVPAASPLDLPDALEPQAQNLDDILPVKPKKDNLTSFLVVIVVLLLVSLIGVLSFAFFTGRL